MAIGSLGRQGTGPLEAVQHEPGGLLNWAAHLLPGDADERIPGVVRQRAVNRSRHPVLHSLLAVCLE